MNNSKIYFYTKDLTKKEEVRKIAASIGAQYSELKASQANHTVSSLVGLSQLGLSDNINQSKAPSLWSMPELIIFFGIPDKLLDTFLAEYKKSGLERIRLKAIVTPTNLGWTIYQLTEHLKEEAKQFE